MDIFDHVSATSTNRSAADVEVVLRLSRAAHQLELGAISLSSAYSADSEAAKLITGFIKRGPAGSAAVRKQRLIRLLHDLLNLGLELELQTIPCG